MFGMTVPQEFAGTGIDTLSFVLVIEEIAKACASTALIVVSHAAACKGILVAGSEAQKRRFIPPLAGGEKLGGFAVHEEACGSAAAAIETKAELHGDFYRVNGSKIFVTNAQEAEVYLVLVRTDPLKGLQGISMLIVEKGTPGFGFGKKDERMGLHGVSSRELVFEDCQVPRENLLGREGEGLQIVGQALISFAFLGAAAISIGIAQAALEAAIRHARERKIAGIPIGTHQAIQFLIAEMSLAISAARSLLFQSIFNVENPGPGTAVDTRQAKLYASEMAIEVTNKALQVHGGHGYHKDYPLERYYRDARGLTLHFKTTELLEEDIGKMLLGL
ncbi:MAG: acyl-CoA dehydrogenase family protein [Chloroflexota bacterium]|nr:acyl-CoA dehydrogenase family protein [Chloroflexota bacterium]